MDKQHKKEQVRQDEDVIISPFGAKLKKVGPNAQSNDISQALTLSNSQAYAKPTYNGVSNAENSFSTKTQPSDQIQSVKPLKLRNEFTGQSFPTHDADEDEYEELDPRAIEAARWVDKEIRKLIGEIQRSVQVVVTLHTSIVFVYLFALASCGIIYHTLQSHSMEAFSNLSLQYLLDWAIAPPVVSRQFRLEPFSLKLQIYLRP